MQPSHPSFTLLIISSPYHITNRTVGTFPTAVYPRSHHSPALGHALSPCLGFLFIPTIRHIHPFRASSTLRQFSLHSPYVIHNRAGSFVIRLPSTLAFLLLLPAQLDGFSHASLKRSTALVSTHGALTDVHRAITDVENEHSALTLLHHTRTSHLSLLLAKVEHQTRPTIS